MAPDELRADHEAEVRRRNDVGLCGCPCGELLPRRRHGRRRYLDGHRDKAYRELVHRLEEAIGKQPRATLATLDALYSTKIRRADAETARKRPQRRNSQAGRLHLATSAHEIAARDLFAAACDGGPALLAVCERLAADPAAAARVRELLVAADAALERRRRRST